MAPLSFLSDPHTVRLLGISVVLNAALAASAAGWLLFAGGALSAVRQRVNGVRSSAVAPLVAAGAPIVGAGATLAAMSAGLGLLLMEGYPSFARNFCFPYALLALAAAIVGRAMQAGGRPIGEE
jgi:hypothetical protein